MMRLFIGLFFLALPLFFSQAESLTQEEARVYREKGYKLQSLGDLKGALNWYQKALQMDPHFTQVYNDIGVIYESQGDNIAAVEMYKRALEIDPNYLAAYGNLGFVYEKLGDIENAALSWKKRYTLGEEGEYWHEVAKKRLLKLGVYPQIRRSMLQDKAIDLAKDLIYKREQERVKLIEEARFHFDIGNKAFAQRDYKIAAKEFITVLSLHPPDEDMLDKAAKLYQKSERFRLREEASANARNALEYMSDSDFLSAEKKLEEALKALIRITQGK